MDPPSIIDHQREPHVHNNIGLFALEYTHVIKNYMQLCLLVRDSLDDFPQLNWVVYTVCVHVRGTWSTLGTCVKVHRHPHLDGRMNLLVLFQLCSLASTGCIHACIDHRPFLSTRSGDGTWVNDGSHRPIPTRQRRVVWSIRWASGVEKT